MAARDATLCLLVEYEIGMRRCGVETSGEVLALARLISAQPHLRFEGVQQLVITFCRFDRQAFMKAMLGAMTKRRSK